MKFRNSLEFHGDVTGSPYPFLDAEYHPLSTARNCLLHSRVAVSYIPIVRMRHAKEDISYRDWILLNRKFSKKVLITFLAQA
jgi:hypothetical protein